MLNYQRVYSYEPALLLSVFIDYTFPFLLGCFDGEIPQVQGAPKKMASWRVAKSMLMLKFQSWSMILKKYFKKMLMDNPISSHTKPY